jgi:hypothetical protein
VIAPLLGALVGGYVGRKVGLAYGRRRADEVAWQIAERLAAPPSQAHFTVHADGTVEP